MDPIEKKSIFLKPSLQHHHSSSSSNANNNHHNAHDSKKQKIIKWDEVTIAEHDKERGSRQKIDEAPTPYRYGSESDQSEAESGSSDGEVLSRRRKVSAGSFDQAPPDPDTAKNTHVNSHHHHHHHHQALAQKYAQHSVMYQWETVHAKLLYEQHLQEMEQQHHQQQHQDHPPSDSRMACDEPPYTDMNHSHHTTHPYHNNPPLDTSNISANSYDAHEHEDDDHEEEDEVPKTVFRWRPPQPAASASSMSSSVSHLGEDPPITDFGELLTTPPTGTQPHFSAPPATSTLPLPKQPPRSALKKSSFAPSGNNGTSSSLSASSGLSKLSIKRSTSQELQLQQSSSSAINNLNNNNNHISTGKSPKSVHIRDLPASASYSPPPPPSPMPPQQAVASSPTYASIVATNNNNTNNNNPVNASYFRYSNPEGSYTTQHSALFAGINASMGGGHGDDDEDDDESDIDNDHGKHTLRINHHHSSTHHTSSSHNSHIHPTVHSTTAHINNNNVHPNGAAEEEEEGAPPTSQFRNKRAGHYNEYKVLMAMRAKMMEEDDEDEDDDDA